MSTQKPNQAMAYPNGSVPGTTTKAWMAYWREKKPTPKLSAATQNIQPIGCPGRLFTMRAPTSADAKIAMTIQTSVRLERPSCDTSSARLAAASIAYRITLDQPSHPAREGSKRVSAIARAAVVSTPYSLGVGARGGRFEALRR